MASSCAPKGICASGAWSTLLAVLKHFPTVQPGYRGSGLRSNHAWMVPGQIDACGVQVNKQTHPGGLLRPWLRFPPLQEQAVHDVAYGPQWGALAIAAGPRLLRRESARLQNISRWVSRAGLADAARLRFPFLRPRDLRHLCVAEPKLPTPWTSSRCLAEVHRRQGATAAAAPSTSNAAAGCASYTFKGRHTSMRGFSYEYVWGPVGSMPHQQPHGSCGSTAVRMHLCRLVGSGPYCAVTSAHMSSG